MTPRIVAALAWYREPLGFLDRCVRSLAGLVDELVALDGAWELFPDGQACSPDEESAAIADAAYHTALDVTIRTPTEVFESQVAKRSALMTMAGERGDWILVIDGDEWVSRGLPVGLRYALEDTACVVADVLLRNQHGGRILKGGLARRLYRAPVTVDVVHSGYFHAGRALYPGEPAVDVRDLVTVEHDYASRGPVRDAQAAEYIRRRLERVEVWV